MIVSKAKSEALLDVHKAVAIVDHVTGRITGVPHSMKAIDEARATYLKYLKVYQDTP